MASDLDAEFDAIVVGSGISGGWAAKELCERGLKVLLVERGRKVTHRADYVTEFKRNWDLPYRGQIPEQLENSDYFVQRGCYAFNDFTKHFFVNDREHGYETPDDKPFSWIRGYQLGGRSILWHRQSYRLSDLDFGANAKDGHGVDWPIRYKDIAPWYDHVETFAGISGSMEGIPHLPDGKFQPPMPLNCVEEAVKKRIEDTWSDRKLIIGRCAHLTAPTEEQISLGRGRCQNRNECQRGCSFGAYFSSLSATLPAAERTGNLTTVTDAIVTRVNYDDETQRATGINVIDANTKVGRAYNGKMVFLCASTLGSTQILLNSTSERFPNGLANSSGALGRNLMDHLDIRAAVGVFPGFEDKYSSSRRATGIYIPRFRNVNDAESDYVRGFGYQGGAARTSWQQGTMVPGVGEAMKSHLRGQGPWMMNLTGFGEMLPDERNRVWLDERQEDAWGIPTLNVDCEFRENERAMLDAISKDAVEIMEAAGFTNIQSGFDVLNPGLAIHEMGTARMGHDPGTSVLNANNQAHDVPNLFVTDGSCMTSSACQNPSLTYMALTARAAASAVEMLQEGRI